VGYAQGALPAMLREMDARYVPSGPGFARTHPSPKDRIAGLAASVRDAAAPEPPAKRQRRFDAAVGGL
jgi:predicted Zn-dependent protease